MSGYIPTYGGLEHHDYFTLHPLSGPRGPLEGPRVCRSGVQIVCMSAWGTQGTEHGLAEQFQPSMVPWFLEAVCWERINMD
jgi:hypothetical protein